MDEPNDLIRDDHQEPSPAGHGHGHGHSLYRLESNHSSASIFEDVEMAQDEVS